MYRIRPNSIMTQNWTKEKILAQIEHHEERMALLATLGIPVTQSNKKDYIARLRNCASQALEFGYIDIYKSIEKNYFSLKHSIRNEACYLASMRNRPSSILYNAPQISHDWKKASVQK